MMRKTILTAFLLAVSALNAQVYPGKGLFSQAVTPKQFGVVKQEKFYSQVMKKDWNYSVYYPAGYGTDGKKYPVLYILHGLTDDYMSWVNNSSAQIMLDKAISAKVIPPTVVIFPDGQNTWYADIPGTNMRSAFLKDLFPYVETNFRVLNDKKARAIGGQSMGGHGALIFAMLKPDYFNAALILSPAITKKGKRPSQVVIDFMKNAKLTHVYGEPFSQAKWDEYSYHTAYQSYLKQPSRASYFIAVGSADVVTPAEDSLNLVNTFKKDKIAYEYMEVPFGIHGWTFWTLLWEPSLIFLGQHLSSPQ